MAEIGERLTAIEQRLARLEENARSTPMPIETPAERVLSGLPPQAQSTERGWSEQSPQEPAEPVGSSATRILGWGGATALVLAAGYLILLAIAGGWLTPTRQIALAVAVAVVLIATGLRLKDADREYASLLPAGGIVILFLSIYGAHLYYGLIDTIVASIAVMAVCGGALLLCAIFNSQLYAFFAVLGSYSAPFLLGNTESDITDLVVYYSCWSVVFSIFSVWVGSRGIYLLALYLALVGFDILWKTTTDDAWAVVLVFQVLQLLIFATCAVVYAIRHKEPMTKAVAIAHAPALLIFYALEYAVLDEHLPGVAPWAAALSAGVLLVAYQIARSHLDKSLAGSKWLVSAYCALVLLHAGYLESVPDGYGPWVALLLVILGTAALALPFTAGLIRGPIGWVIGLIFAGNYARLVFSLDTNNVPASDLLLVLYAVQLYVGYYFLNKEGGMPKIKNLMIYGGHIAAMTAAVYILDNRFAVSIVWALLALGCLLLALRIKDKALGQSSLLIFGASAIKVFAIDLSDATPMVRIACLAALGISLYAGGWLYRKIDALGEPESAT